jgi:hypothetical protein
VNGSGNGEIFSQVFALWFAPKRWLAQKTLAMVLKRAYSAGQVVNPLFKVPRHFGCFF